MNLHWEKTGFQLLTAFMGIHGDVHNAIGGGISNGNMGRVASAGLDPIFFLYHTYVIHPPNRLLALYLAELDSNR